MHRLLCFAAILAAGPVASGDDWPNWMGPTHDNVWGETGLLDKFPQGGPKVVWRAPVAGGYAGPAVSDGLVFVADYVTKDNVKVDNFSRGSFSGTERVLCLDAASGEVKWKHEYPVKYTVSYPAGPRCTPTVHKGKVYTLGTEGHLFCFDAKSGTIHWSKDFNRDYHTTTALWGYASHPLVDGDKLICVVGGKDSHVVAFDLDSGKEIWRSQPTPPKDGQGYSPPTIIEAGGVRQLIVPRPDAVASINPANGQEYWSTKYAATNGSIIMSPIKAGEYLFVAGYSNKNLLLKLASDKPAAEVVWRDKAEQAIAPINVQPFLHEGTLYGFDQNGKLYGVELPSGKRLWQTTLVTGKRTVGSETAFIVKQGDRFWFFNEKGEIVIGKLSPAGFTEIDRAKVIETSNFAFGREVVWCMPAFANRRMYVRNDRECICVDLAK